jgi:CRP-like cAMP-binding protein
MNEAIQSLREKFTSFDGDLDDLEWKQVCSLVKVRCLRKNEVVQLDGSCADSIMYLHEGAIKLFEQHGSAETIIDLVVPGSFMADFSGCFSEGNTYVSFRAIEDSVVLIFSSADFTELCATTLKFSRLWSAILQWQLKKEVEMRRALSAFPAEKRYDYILDARPELIQKFAMKDVSRYIGVTPESLSRIRTGKCMRVRTELKYSGPSSFAS